MFSADTLFLVSSILLHSIGLISTQPKSARVTFTNLEELFPESNDGYFPPIENINGATFRSLVENRELYDHPVIHSSRDCLQRGDFIFAYEEFNQIKLLTDLFRLPLNIYPLFDKKNSKWYILPFRELEKLGVGSCLPFVRALDEVHAVKHDSNHQVNSEAHNAARKVAYTQTRKYVGTLGIPPYSVDKGVVESVKEYYQKEYNQAYKVYSREVSG